MNDEKAHSQLTAIWNKYNQVRLTGDRKAANKILADYIDLLKQQNEKDIKIIVDNICSLALDGDKKITCSNEKEESDKDTRIQHPLFKEIILPILQDQYKRGSAEHIKWIGQMEQFFYSDYTTTRAFLIDLSIPGYFEARHFFEKSFAIDFDQKTLTLLLDKIARDINYYTHEVPTGVLVYPEVLNKEIMVFRHYWQQCDKKNIWEDVLKEWELIAKHWAVYCSTQDEYDNFENYLMKNKIQLN
ncbi:hypothetical protein GVN16_21250 [Emticicia sp. CRIBPO]|uniref:hypothetical protein n=1 Tax=Emticicia sp. CRIBPO TaxID=2683258 RepID=UPI001411E9B2|nr:hypothetical protein [Emticicia sp. CRIBPO]NBA88313.1 hypothetical protein [Emticicia sp. CRIBPO]